MPLTEELLLALIDLVYEAALDPSRWAAFLDRFAETFRGGAALFSQDMRSSQASIAEFARFDPAWLASYASYYSGKNIWLQTTVADPEGTLVVGQDRIDTRTLEASEWYNDWLKPQRLYETCGTILLKNGNVETNIAVIRGRDPGIFTAHELAFWQKLMPHLRRAVQMHRELFAVRMQRNGALQGLDALALGVIVASADARLLFCNKSAERILGTGQGLTISAGRLRAANLDLTNSLHRLIREAAATASGEARAEAQAGGVLALPAGLKAPLCVMVAPLKPEDDLFGLQAPAALLFVTEGSRQSKARADDLVRLYGLTPAEARLACGLVEGLTLQDYADANEIAADTVRTQLKQVFAKTGVNRQSALMRLLLQNPVLDISARVSGE